MPLRRGIRRNGHEDEFAAREEDRMATLERSESGYICLPLRSMSDVVSLLYCLYQVAESAEQQHIVSACAGRFSMAKRLHWKALAGGVSPGNPPSNQSSRRLRNHISTASYLAWGTTGGKEEQESGASVNNVCGSWHENQSFFCRRIPPHALSQLGCNTIPHTCTR